MTAALALLGATATLSAQTTVVSDALPAAPRVAAPAVPVPAVPVPAVPVPAVPAPAVAAVPAVVVEPTPLEVAVAGQIIRTKQLDLRGTTGKILVALIDTGDGRRQIVDLGPTVAFKETPVYTGDQIAVRGLQATLGKLDVVLAMQANLSGAEVFIKRAAPTAVVAAVAVPTGYPVTEQVLKLEGRVEHLRNSRLRGSTAEHLIAEMVTRGGRGVIVDMGPPSQLWRADIKQGEWMTIRGQEMNVNNRPVLLALEINKNGIPHLIDRHLVHEAPAAVVEESTPDAPPPAINDRLAP